MNAAEINHAALQTASERYGEVVHLIDEKSMRWLELGDLV